MNQLNDEMRDQVVNRDESQILEIVRSYQKNRIYLILFLAIQLAYDTVYNIWSIKERKENFFEMKRFYGMLSLHQIKIFYWIITTCKQANP